MADLNVIITSQCSAVTQTMLGGLAIGLHPEVANFL